MKDELKDKIVRIIQTNANPFRKSEAIMAAVAEEIAQAKREERERVVKICEKVCWELGINGDLVTAKISERIESEPNA